MIAVALTMTFQVNCRADELDAHTDLVMEELLKLESDCIADADISATLATGEVQISIAVQAEDYAAARDLAIATIRTAIHAAEGYTPEWQNVGETLYDMATA